MINTDGWITIGTRLSTDKFDKQMSELENKIDSEEKKQELLNSKTKEYEQDLENATRQVNELAREYEKATEKAEQLRDAMKNAPKGSFERTQLTGEYNEQVKKVDQLSNALDKAEATQSRLANKVNQTKLQYQNSTKAVDKLRGRVELINLTRQNRDIKSITDGISGAIKKVGKLALAVLSVRSAYALLRQASSTWGQYNEQYARDLEYIRFALASGLAPILEKIVQLVSTLMTYVNYLSNAWFGRTIFASAKDFEKMKNSAGAVAKSTKEIRNNLASFDELSILSQSTSGGIGSGFLAPSFDLGNIENIEVPEWIKWLGDNGDTVKNALIGIGTGLGALKLSDLASKLGLVHEKLTLLKGFGVAVAIKGIADGIEDLEKYMDDPTLENLGQTISDVGEAVIGVGIATGNLPIIVGGALTVVTGYFVENWDEIRDTTQKGIDYLKEQAPIVEELFGETGKYIYEDVLGVSEDVLGTVDTTINSFNNMFHDFMAMLEAVRKGDWTNAWAKFKDIFKSAWEGITSIVHTQVNSIIRFINFLITRTENFVNEMIDGLNSLGADIQHVKFNKIPLLGQQNLAPAPSMADLGIAGPVRGQQLAVQSQQSEQQGFAMPEFISSIAEGVSNMSQEITVKFEGTMAQFVRDLKPHIEVENRRVGTKIISGGTN